MHRAGDPRAAGERAQPHHTPMSYICDVVSNQPPLWQQQSDQITMRCASDHADEVSRGYLSLTARIRLAKMYSRISLRIG